MKKLTVLSALTAVIILTASGAAAETYRAIVISDAPGGCGFIGVNESGYVVIFTDEGKRLIASHSQNGNSKLICKGQGIPNVTGRALTLTFADIPVFCATNTPHGRILTDDYTYTLSASGNASMTCNFKSPAF